MFKLILAVQKSWYGLWRSVLYVKNDIYRSVTSGIETVVFSNLASVMLGFVVVLDLEYDKIDLIQ